MLSITELMPCFLPSFFFYSVPFLLNLLPDNHCHPTNSTCVTSASCLSCCIKLDLGPQQGQTSGLCMTRGELEGTKLQGIMSMCWNPLLRVCKVWWCDICSSECQRLGWNCFGLYRKKKKIYKFTLLCFLKHLKGGAMPRSFWSLCWQAMEFLMSWVSRSQQCTWVLKVQRWVYFFANMLLFPSTLDLYDFDTCIYYFKYNWVTLLWGYEGCPGSPPEFYF